MERTTPHANIRTPGTQPAILDPRAWGVRPLGRETTGAIQASFAVARPVAAVTLWVHTSECSDVLTYRHFTAERGRARSWDVTLPGLPPGAYDLIVDVPDPRRGRHETWTTKVDV